MTFNVKVLLPDKFYAVRHTLKKYELLKAKEDKLNKISENLKKRENLLTLEKQKLRDKQVALDNREKELGIKEERLRNIIN